MPSVTERGKIRMRIRDAQGTAQEDDVTLNALGVANSAAAYSGDAPLLDLVSEGYQVVLAQESHSWWMPLNPGDYISAVVETISEAVADELENNLDRKVADALLKVLAGLVISVVVTGGATIPALVGAVAVAGAVVSAAVTTALARLFGRRFVVDLTALPPLLLKL